MTPKKLQSGPGQGSMFEQNGMFNNIEEPEISFAPIELAPGVREGDATDITHYLDLYVRAVKEVGRARSNSTGFGALSENAPRVKEFAREIDEDPDIAQAMVVNNAPMHMNRSFEYLRRRHEFRRNAASKYLGGLINQDYYDSLLPEYPENLQHQWYGKPDRVADPELRKKRHDLLRTPTPGGAKRVRGPRLKRVS